MENRKIIILLLVVIVILLVSLLGLFISSGAKADTMISITSSDHLSNGESISFVLTDANSTPLANQTVKIVLIDANNEENEQTVTTDNEGKGVLVLNGVTSGDYTVEVSYDGNMFYSSSSDSQNVAISDSTSSVSDDDNSQGHTVTLELTNYDEYVTKTVGEYRIEAMKWSGTSIGGFGVWVYKNGQLIDRYSYSSRAYFYMNGEWKWSEWDSGEEDANYHKYPVSNDVIIDRVEVSF